MGFLSETQQAYSTGFRAPITAPIQPKLEYVVKSAVIYVETLSFMSVNHDFFLKDLKPLLSKYNKQIRVMKQSVIDLNKLIYSSKEGARKGAYHAKMIIEDYQKHNLIQIKDGDDSSLVKESILSLFAKFRNENNLCVITKDEVLAKQLLKLNNGNSRKELHILRNGKNELESWYDYLTTTKSLPSNSAQDNKLIIEKFKLCNQPLLTNAKPLTVNHIPGVSDTVQSKKYGSIKLTSLLSRGGEGEVYLLDQFPDLVCKIYKQGKLTDLKKQKLELMLAKPVNCPGICWPTDLVYNKKGEFVGYVMPKAAGVVLGNTLFIKPKLQKTFPGWNRKDLAKLCIAILEKINYLHERNVIIGDINQLNILIKNSEEVYFVDTDSYQIENFPCPVGMATFTPPELQKKHNFSDFLRSFENEYFSVATMLFMIMLPGKAPYDQLDGESIKDNILNGDFSYPLKGISNKKTPKGAWRFMWSHLNFNLKFAFYNSFNKVKYLENKQQEMVTPFRENKRLSCQQWINLFQEYLWFLNRNSESCEIYPDNLKLINPVKVTCSTCNKETKTEQTNYDRLVSEKRRFCCWSCREKKDLLSSCQQNTQENSSCSSYSSSNSSNTIVYTCHANSSRTFNINGVRITINNHVTY